MDRGVRSATLVIAFILVATDAFGLRDLGEAGAGLRPDVRLRRAIAAAEAAVPPPPVAAPAVAAPVPETRAERRERRRRERAERAEARRRAREERAARRAARPAHARAPSDPVEPRALSAPTTRAEIHGSLLARYEDPEFDHPVFGRRTDLSAPATWRLVQADVILQGNLGEASEFFVRMSLPGGGNANLTEAWIGSDAIGPGRLTLGQFFRPRGAPIPVLSLSLPALTQHTFSAVGVKYGGEIRPHRIRYEVGLTNTNPMSLAAATIGDAPLIGRPFQAPFTSGPIEWYGHFGRTTAGAWGSLDIGITATMGRLMRSDLDTLQASGIFTRPVGDRARQIWDVSADYIYGPLHLYGEFVRPNQGPLIENVWEVGAGYRLTPRLSAIGSHGRYRVHTDRVAFEFPWTWNRKRTVAGATWEVRSGLQVQGQYEWHDENARDPAGREIDNDRFAVQVLAYW